MALNPPAVMLKCIWLVHFVLTSWALLSGFIAVGTYWFTQMGVLAFGFWAIVAPQSADASLMFLITMVISVVNDCIILGIYEPRGHDIFEERGVSTSMRNEYRFALGMSITNLILKPVSAFLIFRVYQSSSSGSEFNTGFPTMGGGSSAGAGGYDNIEKASGPSPHNHPNEPYSSHQAPYQQTPSH